MKTTTSDSNQLKIIEENFSDEKPSRFLAELNPENVLYFENWIDTNYDRPSENMGSFFRTVYLEDGEPKIAFGNPGDYEPIREFLERAKAVLTDVDNNITGRSYYNPKTKKISNGKKASWSIKTNTALNSTTKTFP